MTLNEAVAQRHSVRNYLDKKIDADTVKLLQAKIGELNRAGNVHLQFLEEAGGTFNKLFSRMLGLGSAPSVIACVAKDDGHADEKVGYYGQQLVLYAQTLGLNTCWAGTFNPANVKAQIEPGEKLVIVIAIGYGRDQGKVRKSKKAEQVTAEDLSASPEWFKKGIDAALLAPTAINQQRFSIRLTENGNVEFKDLGGIFSHVDLGIVRCNFEVGAGKLGK